MLLSLTLLRVTLNSKYRTKNQIYKPKTQKHKNQNTERKEPSLSKEQGENPELYNLYGTKE